MTRVRRTQRRRLLRGNGELIPYSGPIRMPTGNGLDLRTVKQNLTSIYTATSNAAGVLSDYVKTSDVAVALDWSSFVAVYEEFRVVGIRMEYHNYYNGSFNTTRPPAAGLIADTHVPVTAPPTALGDVGQFVNWKTFNTGTKVVAEWRARGTEELQFSNTNATLPNFGGLLWYVRDLAVGGDYGQYVITFLVEFRGRR